MSINVTVSGNPVSIKRGKMVTWDPCVCTKEFEKRRLMRLEQVRQQSKGIAEDVRNKVRKEKEKQLGETEKRGKENLKNWQNRKLLELQNQYKEALKDIGMGHKEAELMENESDILAENNERNKIIAKQRATRAASKLQANKSEEFVKKTTPVENKKLVRSIENTQAELVSNLKTIKNKPCVTRCKKRQPSADIHISVPSGSSSSDESHYNAGNTSTRSDIQSMPNIPEEYQLNLGSSNSSAQCTSSEREHTTESKKHQMENQSSDLHQFTEKRSGEKSPKPSPYCQQHDSYAHMLESHKKLIESFREKVNVETSEDTRISDRIKQRQAMASKPDYCDYASVNPIPDVNVAPLKPVFHPLFSDTDSQDKHAIKCTCNCAACEQLTQKLNSQNNNVEQHASSSKIKEPPVSSKYTSEDKNLPSENSRQQSDINISKQFQKGSSKLSNEISSKPSVKLKGLNVQEQLSEKSAKSVTSEASNTVQYYDHSSKFSSERDIKKAANVEKIDSTSIEVIPNLVSETEMREKMKQRDKDPQARGRKAMEKEKLRKDYEEMMKKLPILQKKERIKDMYKDKPEYHMSEERLRELERKRQNDLENAFIKEFPGLKPAIVTLPSNKDNNVSKTTSKMETQEPVTSSDVPKWDVDFESPKMFSMEEVKEILEVFTGQSEVDRRKKLKKLIKSLKMQEEQLLNEIRNLPQDDSTRELINDLSALVHKDSKKRKPKEKRKRRRESNDSSLEESSSSSFTSQTQSSKGRKDKALRSRRAHTHKTPSPRKKVKIKREILILQNTSTQTTPKPPSKDDDEGIKNKADMQESRPKSPTTDTICNKLHVRCDCHLNKQNQPQQELCEIFIKLKDNDVPEVVVKSKDQETEKISSRKTSETDIRESPRKSPENISPKREEKERPRSTEKQIKQVKPSLDGPEPSAQTRIMPEKKRHHSDPKAKSWKEQLSKNSISTSSTSYMSPPDFANVKGSTLTSSCYDSTKESLSSTRKRSHQRNITHLTAVSVSQTSLGSEHMDARLLNYIRKLVSMSRTSIDELGVSSSDVPTPSQSIIEMETNNPLAHLQNVVKYINLNSDEVMKELSYSADDIPQNGSITASSVKEIPTQILAERKGSTRSNEKILNQYADITDTCSKRIANLAAMIEKLREEKVRMLQTSPIGDEIDKPKTISPGNSEKDFSTAYLDLPHPSEKSKEGSKASSERSLDEEELTRKLLEIDTSLASKLRNFPSTSAQPGSDSSGPKEDDMDSIERELYKRLKKLRETTDLPENNVEQPASTSSTTQFVPFLTDIPRLPKLEALPEDHISQTSLSNSRKRPPPSKGLTTARKFNGDISLVPHELSTIVEADSQISTKVTPSSTKNSPSKDQFAELVVVPENQDKQRTSSDKSTERSIPQISPEISVETHTRCNDRTCAALKNLKEKSQGSSSSRTEIQSSNILSSSSSDDIEAIESMLKSIGMEWAISTLHKTREALQMTSTSSSSDPSKSRPANVSDVSLSRFLKGHVLSDGTSSILEFSDLSGLQNSSSAEKGNRRTSTPIFSSKNLTRCSEKKCKFAEESDISSVKQSSKGSDKYSFHSLSDASLSRTNN